LFSADQLADPVSKLISHLRDKPTADQPNSQHFFSTEQITWLISQTDQ